MHLSNEQIKALKTLCQSHEVKSLYVFGSVLTNQFDETSDIDFIVDFHTEDPIEYSDLYFSLKAKMEELLGRNIDLLELRGIKNPYLLSEINQTKSLVYDG